jgi:hypothetical protein
MFLLSNPPAAGVFSGTSNAAVSANIQGVTVSSAAAAAIDDLGIDANTPVTLADICLESTASRATAYDSQQTATTLVFDEVHPELDGDMRLSSFVQEGGDELAVCGRSKPKSIGLQNLGVQQLMLGDFFIQQINDNWSAGDDKVNLNFTSESLLSIRWPQE